MTVQAIPAPAAAHAAFQRVTSSPSAAWPEPLDLADLARREPQPPRMLAEDWLPAGYATLLAGHGGVGKSGIALYLAVCMAAGCPFFGLRVEQRRVLYLSCEDREAVLHWRLARTCSHLGVDLAALAGSLDILDLVGNDCVLWERDPRTGAAFTAAYGFLEERMKAHGTEVLFVDGISDTFGGNENAKTDVKRYVNALVTLIPPETGAVVLVGHIAKPAATNGQTTEGYSGTTGWHNSARARWYLYPETTQADGGDRERTGDLILDLQKSNLGRTDQSMRFAWDTDAHLFVGREIVGATALDRAHRDRVERRDVLRAFEACAKRNIGVPAATSGQRTTYHVLAAAAEFPETLRRGGKPSRARFRHLIESLRQSGALVPSSYTDATRHKRDSLVLSTEGVRQCVE